MVKAEGRVGVHDETKRGSTDPIQVLLENPLSQEQKTIRPREEISHPETLSAKMELPSSSKPGVPQDAYPDNPQSCGEVQKSFVYGEGRLEERVDGAALVIRVVPRKSSRVFCSGCGRPSPVYDRLEERRFEFVPLWGFLVFLAYRMRRVNCKRCGVTVEMVPWGDRARTN